MPATSQELIDFIDRLADGQVAPDTRPVWADGTIMTPAEAQEIVHYLQYELQYRRMRREAAKRQPANRRAMALLRSLLSPQQRQQLARRRCFDVVASSGARYRFYPRAGLVVELARRGTRYYERRRFCLHGPDVKQIPRADTSLAQLLLLSQSETEFLATAHAHRLGEGYHWVQEGREPVPARAPL